MKKIYIILFAVLLVMITSIFVVSIFFSLPDMPVFMNNNTKQPQFHYMMIGQGTDEAFSKNINEGAMKAASDLDAVVEVCNVRPSDTFAIEQYFDMALDSKVDGIAVQVMDSNKILPYIEKAEKLKIPVVTFETDEAPLGNIPMIGTNSFQVGNEAGKLALECKGGKAKIVVILNGFSSTVEQPSKNLKITGMADAFNNYRSATGEHAQMEILDVKKTDGGVFGAEKVTSEVLRQYPDVNLIIATNEMDTLGVIDVIVDVYKVGQIDVIGYGALPEIIEYIKRNVIYGTVVSDPYKIGYESIKALVDISKTGYSSSYHSTDVYTCTKKNVNEFAGAE